MYVITEEKRDKMINKYKLKAEKIKIPGDVPIVIDDVKHLKTFSMSRCTYFSIECDTPFLGWVIEMRKRKIPLLMLALSGIIYKPMEAEKKFDSPEKFEDLFETIEKSPGVYVDTNDLWLPNFVFDKKNLKPGSVYRIGFGFFKAGYGFRNQMFSKEEFIEQCKKSRWIARYSAKETKALQLWHKMQVEEAKAHYKKHPELSLRERKRREGE
jgi:hypothetical protein